MKLSSGIHLAYCTNIHRGETWPDTFAALRQHTSRVRQAVSPGTPYGIGLRLSAQAAAELAHAGELDRFRYWLDRENSYILTINGFPFGQFHGTRVKEQVYAPDWASPERLAYTCQLFDLLAELTPPGRAASVSTVPGSFKEFVRGEGHVDRILANLLRCHRHIEELRQKTGCDFHLGLEPEPLALLETTAEAIHFFERLAGSEADPVSLLRNIGINYDTCHLAVEYEDAETSLSRLTAAGIRISKLHLSSALSLTPEPAALDRLRQFQDEVYLHQVVTRDCQGGLHRFRDLDAAFDAVQSGAHPAGEEWRVHFHIPLHTAPDAPFRDTRQHLEGALDWLQGDPSRCPCLEMETYTWEVLPPRLRTVDAVTQIIREYEWTLGALRTRNLA